jgi:hypothetical protein
MRAAIVAGNNAVAGPDEQQLPPARLEHPAPADRQILNSAGIDPVFHGISFKKPFAF